MLKSLKLVSSRRSVTLARTMATRVVGIQSGNAVDGIDVGIFDFEDPTPSKEDPRLINTPIKYETLANKTYAYTPVAAPRPTCAILYLGRTAPRGRNSVPPVGKAADTTLVVLQEEREYVLGLRRLGLEDGNDYAVGTYKMGEWFAKRVNDLIAETGIPKVPLSALPTPVSHSPVCGCT